jgi:hypothetical protein
MAQNRMGPTFRKTGQQLKRAASDMTKHPRVRQDDYDAGVSAAIRGEPLATGVAPEFIRGYSDAVEVLPKKPPRPSGRDGGRR